MNIYVHLLVYSLNNGFYLPIQQRPLAGREVRLIWSKVTFNTFKDNYIHASHSSAKYIHKFSPYLVVNTPHLYYKDQVVNAA